MQNETKKSPFRWKRIKNALLNVFTNPYNIIVLVSFEIPVIYLLIKGEQIPVTKSRYSEVMDSYMDYADVEDWTEYGTGFFGSDKSIGIHCRYGCIF